MKEKLKNILDTFHKYNSEHMAMLFIIFGMIQKTNVFRYTFGLCIIESRCITE